MLVWGLKNASMEKKVYCVLVSLTACDNENFVKPALNEGRVQMWGFVWFVVVAWLVFYPGGENSIIKHPS